MIRLIATDLDGTLIRSDGTVSDRSRAALKAAADGGLLVVFVTGRPPRWLDVLVDETGHVGVAVGANGAVIYDMSTEQILTMHALDPAVLADVGTRLRAAYPEVSYGVEYGHGFAAEAGYIHDWQINPDVDRRGAAIPAPFIGDFAAITRDPVVKLLAKDREVGADAFLADAVRLVGEHVTITHSSSVGLLEISAPGITKATGLAEVAANAGINADEVAAIGDMPNDVAMLGWAGRSYAVANAHPSAKAAAQQIVGSNDEDAVAALIEDVLAAR